jgi:hypothetical protein
MATIRKKSNGKFQALVLIKGKYKSVGTFETKKEAAEKAAWAERELKPQIVDDVQTMLERDLEKWKNIEIDIYLRGLDRYMIQRTIDHLELLLAEYKREKAALEANYLKNGLSY